MMTTWILGLALLLAPPTAAAPWPRALATPVQDDLPDGELDLPEGDDDEPAVAPEPAPAPKPEPKPAPKPAPVDDVVAPPDERGSDEPARAPVAEPTPELVDPAQPWVDEDLAAERDGGRRPVDDDLHEIRVGEPGGRVGQADDESNVLESPWLWGGVAGGALLLVGGGVGAGVLVYTLLNADKGNVVITLE